MIDDRPYPNFCPFCRSEDIVSCERVTKIVDVSLFGGDVMDEEECDRYNNPVERTRNYYFCNDCEETWEDIE